MRSQVKTRRVYYVSPDENLFLEQALRSLPGIHTFRGNPGNRGLPGDPFDLYVFDSWLPNALPARDMLIVNPPNSTPLFSLGAQLPATDEITVAAEDSALAAYVDLDEMSLLQYRAIEAPWAQTLFQSEAGAILLAGEANARQIAILPFDLRDSNLPLLIAWPVLMANLLDWFSPSDIVPLPDGLSVGDVLTLSPPLLADSLRITTPSGVLHELPIEGDRVAFADTGQLGLYRLEILQDGQVTSAQSFAVNLFATGESDIRPLPAADLQIGRRHHGDRRQRTAGRARILDLAGAGGAAAARHRMDRLHRRLQTPTLLGSPRSPLQTSMGAASKFLSLITDSSDLPASL